MNTILQTNLIGRRATVHDTLRMAEGIEGEIVGVYPRGCFVEPMATASVSGVQPIPEAHVWLAIFSPDIGPLRVDVPLTDLRLLADTAKRA